ncbi:MULTISPECIES: phosphotransferase [unclassified Lactobacillus]|uniref:phosphotransferase n=1 Tax=unclassified Lactobacillus TaxID=2620435 RepID=UPI001E4CA3E6|nr:MULTISPECIES: phosphotransferase [unclassified Lactobacillus]
MSHNDEREWKLMLRANYISGIVTLFWLVGLLLILIVIEKLPSQSIVIPISVSAMGIIVISRLIIISQWAFAFAYCYYDWQENRVNQFELRIIESLKTKRDIHKETKEILQKKLKANLTQITHQSLNSTFFGYSEIYKQVIFVKVFSQEGKFLTEKTVNEQLNTRVLSSFVIKQTKQFVLVMKDLAPIDIKEEITPDMAFDMGIELSQFHQKVKPFSGIYLNNQLFEKAKFDISSLQNEEIKSRLLQALILFTEQKADIEEDLKAHANTVLHGDVGLRNYKIVAGHISLIDFERARMGVNYQDFIKLFYQDFGLNKELIVSFVKGYEKCGQKIAVASVTQTFLIFITAIGIMKYTEKIVDKPFEKIGEQMLATCSSFLNTGSLNESLTNMNAIIR